MDTRPTSLAEWADLHRTLADSDSRDVSSSLMRAARESLTAVATAVASLRGRRPLTADECRAAVASRRLELLQAATALGHLGEVSEREELRATSSAMAWFVNDEGPQ